MFDERWNFDVFDEYIFSCEANRIRCALKEEKEEKAFALLQEQEKVFAPEEAFKLCEAAIENHCLAEVFEVILEKSPAIEEFRYCDGCTDLYGHAVDIVGYAALNNRLDLLKLMLAQNIDINPRYDWCSILEAALEGASIDCVEEMLSYDDLEIPVTEQLLYIWGNAGRSLKADVCFASVAERILDVHVDLNVDEVPILQEMEINHAIYHSNWPLFRRICQLGAVEKKRAKNVLLTILQDCMEDRMENLDALLTACPALLRDEISRCELVVYVLSKSEEPHPVLKKWIDAMPGKMLVLNHFAYRTFYREETKLRIVDLEKWQDRIGNKLIPTLSRNHSFPLTEEFFWGEYDDFMRWAMKQFCVKGNGRRGEVSVLAKEILCNASPQMVVEMIENGFVLPQEDPAAMMEYCRIADVPQKSYVIAAYMKKENVYDFWYD